jgi:hypothetical protein
METITIPKSEYKRLLSTEKAYKKIAGQIYKTVIESDVKDVVSDFRKTKLYSEDFLTDLEDGLKKSTY